MSHRRFATCRIPRLSADGVVVRVEATGLCRSDWHGRGWATTRTSACPTCPVTSSPAPISRSMLLQRIDRLELDRRAAQRGQARPGRAHGGPDATAPIPMDLVVARELEIVGNHGMAAMTTP